MGLFGFGKDKDEKKKDKAVDEHDEARRKMEAAVAAKRRQVAHAAATPATQAATADSTAMAPPPPAAADGVEYTVRSGDSLSKIAKSHLGDAGKWRQIYEANREVIGDNPDLIKPGQKLRIPGGGSAGAAPTRTA